MMKTQQNIPYSISKRFASTTYPSVYKRINSISAACWQIYNQTEFIGEKLFGSFRFGYKSSLI